MSTAINLVEVIRHYSSQMIPESTGIEPILKSLQNIRAVIFDVYGTLLISGSGEISLAEAGNHEEAIRKAFSETGISIDAFGGRLSGEYNGIIKREHARLRANNVNYPEVEIREVWKSLLKSLSLEEEQGSETLQQKVEALGVIYECLVNPVWPMPEIKETLIKLRTREIKLGIISNAQYYTPLLFCALLEQSIEDLGFDPDCCLWSYKLREGKPSIRLYESCAQRLKVRDKIQPGEVLYVGNDMLNDIWPATLTGFKTALFTGDKHSLRLREKDQRCESLKPDIVINTLSQILDCI